MTESEKQIRATLAAGPTPGPFIVDNDMVYRASDDDMQNPLIHVCTSGFMRTSNNGWCAIDAVWFAACNPDAITKLLEQLDAARLDAERLDWAIALLSSDDDKEVDAKALRLVDQLRAGLAGREAIDAAMAHKGET